MKTLEYPLMATSLSKEQCETIMKPIWAAALPALGINHHLSLNVVHGPIRYQGVGIPDLWTVQGIVKLWLALCHGDARTITGNQLRALMELHTLEIGLPGQLLQQDFLIYGQLATISWLKHLWEFCTDSNIQLKATTPELNLARENDELLMEKFGAYGYPKKELTQLNLCRLYCQATRLSDISTGNGRRIHPQSWAGQPNGTSGSEYSWPIQGRPTMSVWNLWRSAIQQCFLTMQTTQQLLRQPLGIWTTKTPKQWQWMYSPTLDRVYKNSMEEGSIQMFAATPQRRRLRSPKYYSIGTCDILPEDSERTTITDKGNFVWCQGSQPCLRQISTPRTLRSTIHKNDQWAIRKIHYQDTNGKNIARALIQGTAVAVCDGSYKNHFGTTGFVMQRGDNDEERIVGAHVTPGHPDESNAYRS
jgi:hypothetical protein